ncbi:MAG: hypothetical protein OXR62_15215 [Ahrensia sp.]|nr:hypothetical protein [Ahrensia sp.]
MSKADGSSRAPFVVRGGACLASLLSTARSISLALGLAVCATLFATGDDSAAASKAAQYLIDATAAEVCQSGSGQFAPIAVYEGDLTGDGRGDLILDLRGLKCAAEALHGYCGVQACSVRIFIRTRDGLLIQTNDVLSIGFSVGSGSRPVIDMMGHGAKPFELRWNGRRFAQ